MMTGAGSVVVVGTLNLDEIWQVPELPRPGQTIVALTAEQQFGGKGANQAVAAARQGARVTLVGALGNDPDGELYRARLIAEGVDVTHLATVPGVPTGKAHVYVEPRGENLIVVHGGANARIDVAQITPALAHAAVVLVQLECALEIAIETLRSAESTGVRSVLNASPSNAGFPWGRVAIDTVIVNEHEVYEAFGFDPAELIALSNTERKELLARRRVRHLVVTQGGEPTLYFSDERGLTVPAFPVEPRDTVGAGDTFAGALAAELALGREWSRALRYANVAAALSTLALGAQAAMPRRAEVEAAMARGA